MPDEVELLNITEIYKRLRQYGIDTFGQDATDTVLPPTSPFLPAERKKIHPFWWFAVGFILGKIA